MVLVYVDFFIFYNASFFQRHNVIGFWRYAYQEKT